MSTPDYERQNSAPFPSPLKASKTVDLYLDTFCQYLNNPPKDKEKALTPPKHS